MANRHRGEVELRTTDGETFRLRYTWNALCALEDALGVSIPQIQERLNAGVRMTDALAFVAAGFTDTHPEMTTKDVGRLDFEGGIHAALRAAGEAFRLSVVTDGPSGEAGEGDAPPRKAARAGTRSAS